MQLREIMTEDVEVITPNSSIQEAAQCMRMLDIGVLPVCEEERLVGIVTDRDLAIRVFTSSADPCKMRIRDVMSKAVVYCYEDQEIGDAEKMMEEYRVRRIPILNRADLLVGIISLGDLALKSEKSQVDRTLEIISEPDLLPILGEESFLNGFGTEGGGFASDTLMEGNTWSDRKKLRASQ